MNSEEYAKYRKSDVWKMKRKQCMEQFGHRCQVCGCTWWRRMVDVHHLHYRNVTKEQPEDLVPLCSVHHELIHNQPDGYSEKVLQRLKRECEDDYWDDPIPEGFSNRRKNPDMEIGRENERIHCNQCYTHYDFDPESPFCPACGAGKKFDPKKFQTESDSKFLGFADAKLMREVKPMQKAGGIFKS